MGSWLRLDTAAAFAGWTKRLTRAQYGTWVTLLQVVKEWGWGGKISEHDARDHLSNANTSWQEVESLLSVAPPDSLSLTNGQVVVGKWHKYQEDATHAERQSRWKAQKEAQKAQVTVGDKSDDYDTVRDDTGRDGTIRYTPPTPSTQPEDAPVGVTPWTSSAQNHMRELQTKAALPSMLPDLEAWTLTLMREAGGGEAGLRYVKSFRVEDFVEAYKWASKQGAVFMGKLVAIQRNKRQGQTYKRAEAEHKAGMEADRKAAETSQVKPGTANSVEDDRKAMLAAWNALSPPQRRETILAHKARSGVSDEAAARSVWWTERKARDGAK